MIQSAKYYWKFFLLLAALSVAFLVNMVSAIEGYYTEEEIRSYQPDAKQVYDQVYIRKTWYAGDRMRKEEAYQEITIARFDKNVIYILDSPRKIYTEVKPEDLTAISGDLLKAFGVEDQNGKISFPEDLYIRTESTKTIGLWHCYQVITNPKYRKSGAPYTVFWYSAEVGFPAALYGEQLRQIFGDAPEIEGLFDRLLKFEGYPVRTESHATGSNTLASLLRIEKKKDLDPQLFEVPSDYQFEPFERGPGPIQQP